jgi:hypothetical protein
MQGNMYDVHHNFTNHSPQKPETNYMLDEITRRFIEVGQFFVDVLPDGREKALCMTKLEEASMWAKASVARNQEALGG